MARRELSGAPSPAGLLARAGVAMIPGATRLPFVAGGGGAMPDEVLSLSGVAVDRDRLAAYDRVCGFDVCDVLPATYPHVLAFGLQLALMTSPRFPIPAIGLVHIDDRIVAHRRIDAGEPLSLSVWATPMAPHPRGRRFALHTEVRVGSELVWEQTSTHLARSRPPGGDDLPARAPSPPARAPSPPSSELPATARWRLPADLGRRYGAVSGDLNPIHLHPLSAKLFGLPSAIAHGMWSLARCLAALGPQLPDAFVVQAAFKRPIPLPGTVAFAQARTADGIAFGIRDARRDTVHLDGRLGDPPQ